jgi:hypothetical protein
MGIATRCQGPRYSPAVKAGSRTFPSSCPAPVPAP